MLEKESEGSGEEAKFEDFRTMKQKYYGPPIPDLNF